MKEGSAPRRIFAYGTLAAPEVLEALLGRRPPAGPARLDGYARYTVRGRAYPGLVAEPGASTQGLLWEGLGERDIELLDDFEGSLYERIRVRVAGSAPGALAAEVYVVPPDRRQALAPQAWSLDDFRRDHLADYVRHCAGLGRPSAEQIERREKRR